MSVDQIGSLPSRDEAAGDDELHLIGVSFRTAPLPLREAMSFGAAEAHRVLEDASARAGFPEAAVLSTCNRTEFYFVSRDSAAAHSWRTWLEAWRPNGILAEVPASGYASSGSAAAAHLIRVACGLESAVLGDVQIQGQVRAAMQLAGRAGTLGDTLQQTFTRALRAGRRARADTTIARGAPTIGSALAGILEDRLGAGASGSVLIIGAGKVAATVAGHLHKRGFARLVFVNRTRDKADRLAARYGGTVIEWNGIPEAVRHADAVVAATAAQHPVLTRPVLEARNDIRSRVLLVIDAGVPRNVEPTDAVELVNIDAAQQHQQRDLALRQSAVPAVEQIVDQELVEWRAWRARRPVEGLIRQLYQEVETMSRSEAGRLGALPADEAERALRSAFKRLLHDHVRRLRQFAR